MRRSETEAALANERLGRYRAAVPLARWALKEDGITGDDLIRFVNNDTIQHEVRHTRPVRYLRISGRERRGPPGRRLNVFAAWSIDAERVLLRDVVNRSTDHFTSTEEVQTLGFLYESMLKQMRDAAGDLGSSTRRGQWCSSWSPLPTRSSVRSF